MGRRARRRFAEASQQREHRDHQARVHVADDVWRDFRDAANGSISHALGALVEAEVDRYRNRRAADGKLTDREVIEALARADELAEGIAVLVRRLERLGVRPPRGE